MITDRKLFLKVGQFCVGVDATELTIDSIDVVADDGVMRQ